MQRIVPVLVVAAALVGAVLLWPQNAEAPHEAGDDGSDDGIEDQEQESADGPLARELLLDGGVTQVPIPEHRAPEELRGVEEAARAALAERQLEHLRTMAELAEQGSDPERARLMRARIEALEEARRAAANANN